MNKEQIRELADKIIADYKEHYDFPTQGESHMHDCIVGDLEEFAQLEKAPDPAGFQIRNSYSKNEWTGRHGFTTTEEAEQCGAEWRYVYTSPPDVAELQKQVQALQAENKILSEQVRNAFSKGFAMGSEDPSYRN